MPSAGTRIRALFVLYHYPPGGPGGAERQAQLQAEELVRRGHQVTVVAPREPGTASGTLNGVRVVRLPVPRYGRGWQPAFNAIVGWYVLRRAREYDLVHVHLAGPHLDAVVAAAHARGRPVYVKLAAGGPGGDVAKYPSYPLAPSKWGLLRANRLQAISPEIAGELRELGVRPPQLVEIPNGLDLGRFGAPFTVEERDEARRRLGLPLERVLVLYVGRLHPEKGTTELLTLWGDASRRPDADLVMVGENKHAYDVEALRRMPGVHYREYTQEILAFYRASDVFLLPSHTEGMSNALLEAMACGLPAVATRVGAAEVMVAEGESGLLVDAGDVDGMARALTALVGDAAERARMGAAAALRARAYGIGAVVDRLEAAYRELLAVPR